MLSYATIEVVTFLSDSIVRCSQKFVGASMFYIYIFVIILFVSVCGFNFCAKFVYVCVYIASNKLCCICLRAWCDPEQMVALFLRTLTAEES